MAFSIWFFKGAKRLWGPCIEIHYKISYYEGLLGCQDISLKDPIRFFWCLWIQDPDLKEAGVHNKY